MNQQTKNSQSVQGLFTQHRPPFITFHDSTLHIADKAYTQLTVIIHEIIPVRKFFQKRKLKCYSTDCRTGKDGTFCELCQQRHQCSQRLQLRLAYFDGPVQHPAILELPQHCFEAFNRILNEVGDFDHLKLVPIGIKPIDRSNGRLTLEFQLLH